MFTAKMAAERIKDLQVCDGIDEWIEKSLIPMYIGVNRNSVNVYSSAIKAKGWTTHAFIKSMIGRGFHAEEKCEDRPCSYPYVVISLPPQDE